MGLVIRLSQPSAMTAFLATARPLYDGSSLKTLGFGSGFLVRAGDGFDLITNWHVLTGRDPLTDEPKGSAALPDRVDVSFWAIHSSGTMISSLLSVPLYDSEGRSLWRIHPTHGRRVDVVALSLPPMQLPDGIRLVPYDIAEPSDPTVLSPTSDVSIVGFPDDVRDRTTTAVWTRGTVASEPALDFDDLPCFLVDARGREGQSGSPVIGYWTPDRARTTRTTGAKFGLDEHWELFGIYSGRITEKSDLGRIWKRSAIRETSNGGARDNYEYF
jgi:hypothetical protein